MRYTTMALNRIQYTKLIVQCVTLFPPIEELVSSSVANKVNKTGCERAGYLRVSPEAITGRRVV